MDYRKTVNLPHTEFPMRANLPAREPEVLARWNEEGLFSRLRAARAGRPRWILHDGPPYASGSAHVGTAMNKVLKDMIVRFRTLDGFDAPYVPGWDTHGLPIEHQVMKEAGLDLHTADPLAIRGLCREFALRHIRAMTDQFVRLGVLGDWDRPYRTLDGSFEAAEVRVFGEMARNGFIFKGLRPVYWCGSCETALAEAEIEYHERESPSIWVAFPVADGREMLPEGTRLLIWTTTPWTIPGNQAIAVHPDVTYDLVETRLGRLLIARDRLATTLDALSAKVGASVVASFKGSDLEGITYRHPLYGRISPVVLAGHVTVEEGTGLVHTAPGHGREDFEVGSRYGLPITVPLDAQGRMTSEAGPFEGLAASDANGRIAEALAGAGALLGRAAIRHQYPHCWRCHSPLLYRATEQWFADIEKLRQPAMEASEHVEWVPGWGERRMKEMVAGRGDWCLSRQRVWGVPIPVFYCRACGEALLDEASVEAVAGLFEREGSDAWWSREAGEILPADTRCAACGGEEFRKDTDIFDVWFDAGSSHAAVLQRRPELAYPADLYLEGHNDQFRGWYQASLLTSVATRGRAPYKGVLSHGFVVDLQGRHMHKSWGNTIDPMEVVGTYGADVFRLWVMSTDYTSDVRIGDALLDQVSEAYRKIRNTARFLLGNLDGFDPDRDREPGPAGMPDLDLWALGRAAQVQEMLQQASRRYDFRAGYNAIHNFCVNDLSAFYLNARKDALYTAAPDSPERRAARAAIHRLARALVAWIAPVLPFTAEEIWHHLPKAAGEPESVHLGEWPELPAPDEAAMRRVGALLSVRDAVAAALEAARQGGALREPAEALVTLSLDPERLALLREFGEAACAEALVVSEVELRPLGAVSDGARASGAGGESGAAGVAGRPLAVGVVATGYRKCERCWRYVADVGLHPSHPTLCGRCVAVVEAVLARET